MQSGGLRTVGIAVLLAVVAVAGAVAPTAARHASRPPTEIDACTTITEPGEYALAEDITDAAPTDTGERDLTGCLRVESSDVVVRGRGHTLDGTGDFLTTGVSVNDSTLSNVTVRNLTVTEWSVGVNYDNVTGGVVANVTATRNDDGMRLREVGDVTVRDATVTGNRVIGLSLTNATDAAVRDTTVRENLGGVSLANARTTDLSNVTASDNEAYGVNLFNTTTSRVTDSAAVGNDWVGVVLTNSTRNAVTNVSIRDTTGEDVFSVGYSAGLALDSTARNRLVGLDFENNSEWAVYATNDTETSVERATVESATVSLRGRNVALAAADAPDAPAGYAAVAPPLRATNTSDDAFLDLTVAYADAALARANVAEETLRPWRYDGAWSPVAGPNALDADANAVSANVTEFGVLAVLGRSESATTNRRARDVAGARSRLAR